MRVRCLLELDDMSYETYRDKVTPRSLFEAQRVVCDSQGCVFVLGVFLDSSTRR